MPGRSLNKELLRAGLAWWYQHCAPRDGDLATLEVEARRARRATSPKPHVRAFPYPHCAPSGTRSQDVVQVALTLFRPFLEHLAMSNLSPKTIQKHVDNLWALGGEFIRDLHNDPSLRRRPVDQALSKMIEYGGPLLYHGGEDQQRSFASSGEFVGECARIQRDEWLKKRWSFLQVESKERCWSSSDSMA